MSEKIKKSKLTREVKMSSVQTVRSAQKPLNHYSYERRK